MEEQSRRQDDRPFDPAPLFRGLAWLCVIAAIALVAVFATVGYNAGSRYYWGMFSALLPIVAFALLRRATQRAVIRRRVRRRWGHPREDKNSVSYKSARGYFRELSLPAARVVDDRTWDDLAMDDLLEHIDACYSPAGRNELYVLLRECLPPRETAAERDRLIARLRRDEGFRISLIGEIAPLENGADHDPSAIMNKEALIEDPLFPLYLFLSITAVALLFSPVFLGLQLGLFAIIAILILNMWIYYRKSRQISALVPSLRGLFRLLKQAGRIAAIDFGETGFDAAALQRECAKTARLSRLFRSVLTGSSAGSASASADILEALTMYLKILFLVDLMAYSRLVTGIRRLLDPLKRIYRTVGRLDAIHSVSSFLEWAEIMKSPELVESAALSTGAVYHPLLEEPVANSIELDQPGAIVTGTNMAGKSTFLRTIGINAILAQTIGACFAESYRGARFLVMSSIEKRDVLDEGKSFYYAEAERIFRMLESLEDGTPVLLLIDELLSGTNSLEREGASVAILEYLSRHNALTVAATHDVTIARKLEGRYDLYYFTDRATDTGLSFDYLIRPGVVETRNAIKLLSLIGYPDEVIESALRSTDPGDSGG